MDMIINSIKLSPILIDGRIQKYLNLIATAEMGDKIRGLFKMATVAVADQIELEKREIQKCNCIFTDLDAVTFIIKSDALGMNVHFCVYPFHKWSNATNTQILVYIIEELTHFFWSIEDEYQVCFKVHEILSNRLDVTIEHLFNTVWMDKNKPKG